MSKHGNDALLEDYFNELLQPTCGEVPAEIISEKPVPKVLKPAVPEPTEKAVPIEIAVKIEPINAENTTPNAVTSDLTQVLEESLLEFAAIKKLQQQLAWHPNGRPVWAQEEFEVFLFMVSGLRLAVPLIALGEVQPLTDELCPLFPQIDGFMGLQPTSNGKVRTVNTAGFVMPERYDENFPKEAKYVISINGMPWGLAVNSVQQSIKLEPEDVKWRTAQGSRPWLAGTVKKEMCALLDIAAIGKMLSKGNKNTD